MSLDNEAIIKQVEELAVILSPWNSQLVLGGGVALILYDVLLSKANRGAISTTDIDFLIPREPVVAANENIYKLLTKHGYETKFKSMAHPSVQSYIDRLTKN